MLTPHDHSYKTASLLGGELKNSVFLWAFHFIEIHLQRRSIRAFSYEKGRLKSKIGFQTTFLPYPPTSKHFFHGFMNKFKLFFIFAAMGTDQQMAA